MGNEPTVSLQIIVKDEVEDVRQLIDAAHDYFDVINVTQTNPGTYKKWVAMRSELRKEGIDFNLDQFKWVDDFAAARNHNLKSATCDYFFWLDADDSFDFSTIPKLVQYAERGNYDALYLPYNYAQDEHGNCIALHHRERLLRTSKGFEWRGAIHESLLQDQDFKAKKLDEPVVVHNSKDHESSMQRNHKILESQVAGVDNPDPRMVHYLALSYFSLGKYESAIETFKAYIPMSGWDEEVYRSLIKIGEAYFMLNNFDAAMEYTLKAAGMMPSYPDAYLALARYEYAHENWREVLDWVEVAFSKPKPQTMAVVNPQNFDHAKFYAAVAQHELGNHVKAYKYLMTTPEYMREGIEQDFKDQANLETFINLIPELTRFIEPKKLYKALPYSIKHDRRLKPLRNVAIEPRTWGTRSIVFYCGAGYEEWGAHTLSKGMGGSEEAVVYLSRELSQLGFDVVVYNSTSKSRTDGAVKYLPHQEFDERDHFDTLVVWRQPQLASKLHANKLIVDMHDILPSQAMRPLQNGVYFVKSQYHRELYPDVPDDNFKVIGNGIVKDQFMQPVKERKPHSVGYFSAYYRGLEMLLDMWPKIREKVPDATLDIYYGWESWLAFEGEDDFYKRMVVKMKSLEDQGVTEHGRVSHEKLASKMAETQVWAYPTQFAEIHCITALKAQEAGCYPVVTSVAALKETVQSGVSIDTDHIYSDEYSQQKFIDAVVDGLENGKQGEAVEGVDWSDVAKQWKEHIDG